MRGRYARYQHPERFLGVPWRGVLHGPWMKEAYIPPTHSPSDLRGDGFCSHLTFLGPQVR